MSNKYILFNVEWWLFDWFFFSEIEYNHLPYTMLECTKWSPYVSINQSMPLDSRVLTRDNHSLTIFKLHGAIENSVKKLETKEEQHL